MVNGLCFDTLGENRFPIGEGYAIIEFATKVGYKYELLIPSKKLDTFPSKREGL
jgi:hypothetical protein